MFVPSRAIEEPLSPHYSQAEPFSPNFHEKSKVLTLSELISIIREELGADRGLDSEDVNVPALMAAFNTYLSNPSEWQGFASWSDKSYTRNLIDTGNGQYNLILLCWSEGQER
jgi:cysteine dioxygenase